MNDLVKWLNSQLDADEARAKGRGPIVVNGAPEGPNWRGYSARRVLAEVDVKRRLITLHPHSVWPTRKGPGHLYCGTCDVDDGVIGGDGRYCLTLRLLAAPFDGRAGYRDEWRP